MKKNKQFDNRGFVIVETIIVAVFIIGICTFLFANFLPLIGDYERISNYDDLDSKYKTHEIKKMILREVTDSNSNKSIFTNYINNNSGYHIYGSYDVTSGDKTVTKYELCDNLNSVNYCNKLLGTLFIDVKEIIVASFKLVNLKNEIKDDSKASRALKEYIDYLPKYNKYPSSYDNYYRLIVVFNNGKMANIEVKYETI